MAKDLAKQIGYVYIDSGSMYRATTLFALQKGFFVNNQLNVDALEKSMSDIRISFRYNPETGKPDTYLNDEKVEDAIRSMEVASKVSEIASLKFVRQAMVQLQQAMGHEKGIVMDGRDIGTVVFPDAELKVFVTARADVRANRRLKELREKGDNHTTFDEVLANVVQRDEIDQNRTESPLRKAEDALLLDNSDITIDEQRNQLLQMFHQAINK